MAVLFPIIIISIPFLLFIGLLSLLYVSLKQTIKLEEAAAALEAKKNKENVPLVTKDKTEKVDTALKKEEYYKRIVELVLIAVIKQKFLELQDSKSNKDDNSIEKKKRHIINIQQLWKYIVKENLKAQLLMH
ncbi:uncharacterized protein LOC119669468 [Teleopsis dalmanni]|uniref:uncharacterized protein LOC119669468 n=1 Tax=Teleopsis dalmanni TaxID=139649 RepID=UPI0018CCB7AF|nr:uncharacterized protein LOC119669468 [Teleopsis dalmanni]